MLIYEAMLCLSNELNSYFQTMLKIHDEHVVVSNLVNPDGSAIAVENKIILTLVNTKFVARSPKPTKPEFYTTTTPWPIELYVLLSAYFSSNNYADALRQLSMAIDFFEAKTIFNSSNTAGLHSNIRDITIEPAGFDAAQIKDTWAMLGARYMPSAIYKIQVKPLNVSLLATEPLIKSTY